MSAFKVLRCEIVSKEILLKALDELGWKYTVHEEPQKLKGYTGDVRKNEAEIIVDRASINTLTGGASNELGFKFNTKHKRYDMVCSDYDAHNGVNKHVVQKYAHIAIKEALAQRGFAINCEETSCESKPSRIKKATTIKLVAGKVI